MCIRDSAGRPASCCWLRPGGGEPRNPRPWPGPPGELPAGGPTAPCADPVAGEPHHERRRC
eukprot:2097361-Alexandrium_andersonii.AAC.1